MKKEEEEEEEDIGQKKKETENGREKQIHVRTVLCQPRATQAGRFHAREEIPTFSLPHHHHLHHHHHHPTQVAGSLTMPGFFGLGVTAHNYHLRGCWGAGGGRGPGKKVGTSSSLPL